MTVGDRIRHAREQKGISQEELAKRLGLKDKSSVCKIEKAGDNVSTKSIRNYAAALDTSPSFLMGWITNEDDINHYNLKQREDDIMGMLEKQEAEIGTAGVALRAAIYRMAKSEIQNLYDVAKIMFPHAFIEKE